MKRAGILILVIFGMMLGSKVFAQQLEFVKQIGSTGFDEGRCVAVTNDNCVVTAGSFSGEIVLGRDEFFQTTLTSSDGSEDVYIAKYGSFGNLIWAKRAGGIYSDKVNSIAAMSDGKIVITGVFSDSMVLGPSETGQINLASNGNMDAFLAVYNTDGTISWGVNIGGTDEDKGECVAVHPTDNTICVGGIFKGSVTFDASTTLNSLGDSDVFVAKYNSSGTFDWAKKSGSTSTDYVKSIGVKSDGSVCIFGNFYGNFTIGTGDPSELSITAVGVTQDIFLAQYSSSGVFEWIKHPEGNGTDVARGMKILPDNTIVTCGAFGGSAGNSLAFGLGETVSDTIYTAGDMDIFTAKFASSGNFTWAAAAGGSGFDVSTGITADTSSGNVFVCGSFESTASFTSPGGRLINLVSAGSFDGFIVQYSDAGSMNYAVGFGGSSDDVFNSAAFLSGNSALYTTGIFSGNSVMGSGNANQTNLVSAGGSDSFLAKYCAIPAPSGWVHSGAIGTFGPTATAQGGGFIGISGQGASNSYGFWLSPSITIKRDKVYRIRFSVSSSIPEYNLVPQFRLRVTQGSNWASWMRVVDSTNNEAPVLGSSKDYDVYITPSMTAATDTINCAFELMSFNPADTLDATVYLYGVSISEADISIYP